MITIVDDNSEELLKDFESEKTNLVRKLDEWNKALCHLRSLQEILEDELIKSKLELDYLESRKKILTKKKLRIKNKTRSKT